MVWWLDSSLPNGQEPTSLPVPLLPALLSLPKVKKLFIPSQPSGIGRLAQFVQYRALRKSEVSSSASVSCSAYPGYLGVSVFPSRDFSIISSVAFRRPPAIAPDPAYCWGLGQKSKGGGIKPPGRHPGSKHHFAFVLVSVWECPVDTKNVMAVS